MNLSFPPQFAYSIAFSIPVGDSSILWAAWAKILSRFFFILFYNSFIEIYLSHSKLQWFKMCNLMRSGIWLQAWNHYCSQDIEHMRQPTPKVSFWPLYISLHLIFTISLSVSDMLFVTVGLFKYPIILLKSKHISYFFSRGGV